MDSQQAAKIKGICVGIDYGTTFTSVSYHITKDEDQEDQDQDRPVRALHVKTIKNWPDEPTGLAEQVPTESWYPSVPMSRATPCNQFDASKDKPSDTRLHHEYIDDDAVNQSDEESNVDDVDYPPDSILDDDFSTEFFWGYTVSYQRYHLNTTRNQRRLIQRPKLMLLSTDYTEGDRKDLRRQVNYLIQQRIIRKYGKRNAPDMRDITDVITDFLIKVLEHTNDQLTIHEGFVGQCPVDFVIAVPTIWSPAASRILQSCLEAAISATGFGRLANGSLDNPYFTPEPEAGVTWLLQNTRAIVVSNTMVKTYDFPHASSMRLNLLL